MYMFAGCHDPIQKISGDAYQKCYSMGVSGFPLEQMKIIRHWSDTENEKINSLLVSGLRATDISRVMEIDIGRVKKKIDYIMYCHRADHIQILPIPAANIVQQFTLKDELITEYQSIGEAANKTGIQRTNICKVLNGRRPVAGGYVWKYKNAVVDGVSSRPIVDKEVFLLLAAG